MINWFEHLYPYSNMHELNLDWIIQASKKLYADLETFKNLNSLTFADPILWDITTQYSRGTIVLNSTGDAYVSKKIVPAGIQLDNSEYWEEIFNFADYVRTANSNLTFNIEIATERASQAYAVDDWLIWNDVLYKVTSAIDTEDLLVIGTNIVHFTVEDFIKAWITYATNLINQYKNDIDASELGYKNELSGIVTQYKNDIDASESAYRAQLAGDIASTTASLQAQLNTAIAGATVDSELINIRVGANGKTYPTAGDAVRGQFSDLYSALRNKYINESGIIRNKNTNLFNYNSAVFGFIDNSDGSIKTSNSWIYSPEYVPIEPGENLYFSGSSFVSYYDSGLSWISGVSNTGARSITVPSGAKYMRFSFNGNSPTHYVIFGTTASNTEELQYTLPGLKPDMLFGSHPSINGSGNYILPIKQSENLYNYYNAENGFIDASNGNVVYNAGWWYSPTYSEVEPNDILRSNFSGFYAFYDKNGKFVSGISNISGEKTVPAGCYYVRISSSGHDKQMCVTRNDEDTGKGLYYAEILGSEHNLITVGPSNLYDYQSFTEAVYKSINSGREIVVYPGVYDIEQEYNELFTAEIVDAMTDETNLNGFQLGIVIQNRKVKFLPGAKLVCDWSNHTVSGTRRFSVIFCGMNCEIEGMDLDATGTFYVVHEDAGGSSDTPYIQRFTNCVIIGHSIYNGQCWGGGCGKKSKHIIKDCYMNNNDTSENSLTGRYHSTGYANGVSDIYIENSWFNSKFDIRYNGFSSTKTKAYVCGCYAPNGINKNAETPASQDNVELIEWNNLIN